MQLFKKSSFLLSLLLGGFMVWGSLLINGYAVNYANQNISNPVTDIVLSNTRVYNVDWFFVYGAVLLVAFIALACIVQVHRAPFALKAIGMFTLIRSFFISLTHISPYPTHVVIGSNIFTAAFPNIFTGSDLFFSGHTGLPFLMALVLWEYPLWRYLFLAFSALFGVVVLLGHLHYSIDVASAFFITYTIFAIAKICFKHDWVRAGV